MKKNLRTFLIMLLVLVLVGGGAAALLLTQPTEETAAEEESSSSQVREPLLDLEPEQVASLQVENAYGAFTLVPLSEEEAQAVTSQESAAESAASSESSVSSGQEEDTHAVLFTLEEYREYEPDTLAITEDVEDLLGLAVSKDLGALENLEPYGLEEGDATQVTIQLSDGSAVELAVGTQAGETVGNYVLYQGTVTICNMSTGLLENPLHYLGTEVYTVESPAASSDTESSSANILYYADITTEEGETLLLQYDQMEGTYLLNEPVLAQAEDTAVSQLVTALQSLTASQVAAAGLTQENLEAYGLSQPAASITFQLNEEVHTLQVSAPDAEGNRYLTSEGSQLVYQVAGSAVDVWAQAQAMDLRTGAVWQPSIEDVSSLTFTVEGDQVYQYTVTRTEDEASSTEGSVAYTYTVTDPSGQEVAYEDYQSLFDSAMGLSVLSMDPVTQGETPVLTIQVSYFTLEQQDEIAYYPVEGQERYAATLNGTYSGLVRSSDVTNLLAQLQGDA